MATRQQNITLMYGLSAGLAIILFTVVLYLGGIKVYLSGFAYLGYVILVGAAVMAALRQKKINNGYLEFAEAQKTVFSVLVIAMLAQTFFTWLLMNYIDTDFKNAVAQVTLEKAEAFMRKMGMSGDQIDKAVDSERSKNQFSFGRTSLGFAVSCIFMFIIALIISAIVKKKKPEFPVA